MLPFLTAFFGAAGLSWFLLFLELVPWHRTSGAHWTERARALFTARVASFLNAWLIPGIFAGLSRIFWPDVGLVTVVAGAFLGAIAGVYPFDRETSPSLSGRSWIHLAVANLVLRSVRWGPLIVALVVMPQEFGWSTWMIAAVFLVMQLAGQFGLGLMVLRGLRLLRPASPRLESIVQAACRASGITVRATWELNVPQANALAYVTTRELVFTTRLMAVCSDEEIRAICFHELAHVAESRWVMAARVGSGLAMFPLIFAPPVLAQFGLGGVAALAFAAGGIWWMRGPLVRAMERKADEAALEATPETGIYASALEQIHRENLMPAVMRKSRHHTHPDLYDRMIAANITPAYPRPTPPSGRSWTSTTLTVGCVLVAMYLITQSHG